MKDPWASRASSYLPVIEGLSDKKWKVIFDISATHLNTAPEDVIDLAGESSEGGIDPRGLVNLSEDSEDEDENDKL